MESLGLPYDLGENGWLFRGGGVRSSPGLEAPEWGHRGFAKDALLDRPCVGHEGSVTLNNAEQITLFQEGAVR